MMAPNEVYSAQLSNLILHAEINITLNLIKLWTPWTHTIHAFGIFLLILNKKRERNRCRRDRIRGYREATRAGLGRQYTLRAMPCPGRKVGRLSWDRQGGQQPSSLRTKGFHS